MTEKKSRISTQQGAHEIEASSITESISLLDSVLADPLTNSEVRQRAASTLQWLTSGESLKYRDKRNNQRSPK